MAHVVDDAFTGLRLYWRDWSVQRFFWDCTTLEVAAFRSYCSEQCEDCEDSATLQACVEEFAGLTPRDQASFVLKDRDSSVELLLSGPWREFMLFLLKQNELFGCDSWLGIAIVHYCILFWGYASLIAY